MHFECQMFHFYEKIKFGLSVFAVIKKINA